MESKRTFTEELWEAYQKSKKPIAYLVMLSIVAIESLPPNVIPDSIYHSSLFAAGLILGLIILQILFEIYDKVTEDKNLSIMNTNELLTKIYGLANDEKEVSIKYIGIAGRYGWATVIKRMLDSNSDYSLAGKKLNISMALLSPEYQQEHHDIYARFINNTQGTKDEVIKAIEAKKQGQNVELSLYKHMPNVIGFLINDNYLFITFARWGEHHGEFSLRGGGADKYFVYDKNDDFGGSEMIEIFDGWFKRCTCSSSDTIRSNNVTSIANKA